MKIENLDNLFEIELPRICFVCGKKIKSRRNLSYAMIKGDYKHKKCPDKWANFYYEMNNTTYKDREKK